MVDEVARAKVITVWILAFMGLVLLCFLVSCGNPSPKPEVITPPVIAPPISQIIINVENYETWGDYAVLRTTLTKIWWRVLLIAGIILIVTKYLSTKTIFIPKMLLSFLIAGGVYGISFIMFWFFGKFIWGQVLIDCLLAIVVANLFYSGILKGKLFKKD